MVEGESQFKASRLPHSWSEQQKVLPQIFAEREGLAVIFYQEVGTLLAAANIFVIASSYRTKTDESIQRKLLRRLLINRYKPVVDIFGTRFIVHEDQIDPATQVVINHFQSPAEYPWGLSSVIDHRKQEVRSYYSSPRYKAVHLYVPFGQEEIQHIGEVQLLTPEWRKSANRTRRYYERRQDRH